MAAYYNQYANVSEAYDFSDMPETTYGNTNRQVKRRVTTRKVRRKRIVFLYKNDNAVSLSLYAIATVMFIFVLALGVVCSFATITEKQMKVASAKTELKKMRDANIQLRTEIAQSLKLDEIEFLATTKLGMTKPQAYQIVHISVPKQSYVIQSTVAKKSAEKVNMNLIYSYLKDIVKVKRGVSVANAR